SAPTSSGRRGAPACSAPTCGGPIAPSSARRRRPSIRRPILPTPKRSRRTDPGSRCAVLGSRRPAKVSSAPHESATMGTMPDAKPLLLVVDDEDSVLSLVRRVGEAEGFDVITSADGRAALETAGSRRPDLVLVDLRMPDVGGLDIVRAVREAVPKATIVLMTGHATIDSAVEAVKLGAADYLTKPFDLPRLKAMFAGVREEAERRAAAP